MGVFIEAKDVDSSFRLIDTRFSLKNPDEGRLAYQVGHISGAIYWDLNRDLSDMSSACGRHPMPTKQQIQHLIERAGLTANQPIAIYDAGGEPYATRAFWLLSYAGFEQVFVVNGGYKALIGAGFEVTSEVREFAPTSLELKWQEVIFADRADVKAIVDRAVHAILLDAREEARYLGEMEPIDRIAGHIPGARNYFWGHSKEDNQLIVTSKLEQTVAKDEEVVVYCGSGVTASPVYALLKHAGYDRVKMYVGSYSDWITAFDVATGKEG